MEFDSIANACPLPLSQQCIPGATLYSFFANFLKLFILLGSLSLLAVWNGLALVLYVSPATIVAYVWEDNSTRAPVFLGVLFVTGLIWVCWKRFESFYVVRALGNKIIWRGMERMTAMVDDPSLINATK
ncbi:hypothetical protein LP421_10515 [Rhizobium sp. RCAM05350]|nr:hypothetical protein LP421_10515 [Rhizobium sp. RCAM05350]